MRTPSMMLAWFSSSEMMTSSSPRKVAVSPVLAVQHETYVSAASVPMKEAIFSSSSRWTAKVPQMNRTEAVPAP